MSTDLKTLDIAGTHYRVTLSDSPQSLEDLGVNVSASYVDAGGNTTSYSAAGVLISIEGNAARWTVGRDTAGAVNVPANAAAGHNAASGSQFMIMGSKSVSTLRLVNSVNAANAVVQVTTLWNTKTG